jgi:D-amino-acid dehydrogenase
MPGVFFNTGHGHLGWTLSAATAQMIAGTIDGWRGLNAPPTVPSRQAELGVERELRHAS